MSYRILKSWILTVGLLSWMPAHADAIRQLEQFFTQTHTLKGNFIQRVFTTRGGLQRTSYGDFELERPDRFNWTYTKPSEQKIVSNGTTMWIYDRDLAQVTVSPVTKRLGQAPIMLLGGGEPLGKHFALSDEGNKGGLDWVKLIPKNLQESQFSRIQLGLGDGLVKEMVLYDQLGHRTVLELSHLSVNQVLPASDFSFVPPSGVDVVHGM